MDGILTGLTSVIPILPGQTTITDRSGVNRPPVEILPLPSNSFMTDDTAAEQLHNPFTLNLDKDRYSGSGNEVSKAPVRSGHTAPAEDLTDAMLNEAYTLSLSSEENTPEIAQEITRMKNYEMLGKAAARHVIRKNPETDAAAHLPVQVQDGDVIAQPNEKVGSLPAQMAAQQNEALVQLLTQSGEITTHVVVQDVILTQPEIVPEAQPQSGVQPAGEQAVSGVRQDLSLLSGLTGLQLSASDIEAVLTLEPELQEALLNMLNVVNKGLSGKPVTNTPEAVTPETAMPQEPGDPAQTNESAAQPNALSGTAVKAGARHLILSGIDIPIEAQPGNIQQTLNDIPRLPDILVTRQAPDLPDQTRTAPLSDEELTRLAAETLTAARAQKAPSASTLRGDMTNLEKIKELPYALYLFGNVSAERKAVTEEDVEMRITEKSAAGRTGPSAFLRISEAVKMAAVLHNIYYGGSGRFPEETPWYGPYVRYAVKSGIIKSGEFGDYNEFATRAETAYIISGSVPRSELPIINYISDISDVSETFGYGDRIYLLFRAGVLAKSSGDSRFYPERMITRTEAAALIGRIATPTDRKLVINS